jgi:hypothetical protein
MVGQAGWPLVRSRVTNTAVLGSRLCRIRYQADLFWVTEVVGNARIEDLLEVFSRDREGRAQSVIEVKL